MTTFTATINSGAGIISVDSSRILSEIKDEIYSGFTEHMGRCIYGGIYDPGNPLSDENGFRKDVIESVQELNVPVVRYPGGNFVATYHWLDGVGPKEQRPKRPELAWLGVESNEFGTDEFLKWCEVVGTEPYFALNFGTGTLDEALAWVEYCNGEKDTYYANLRRKNGREKPYNVKYWALGNEMWGPWQIGQLTKEDYAKQATQWAKALKLLDPSLILILCGETGYSDWDRYVLQECIQFVDMHSIHIYTADKNHHANVTAPLSAERAIEMSASLIDLARIIKGVEKRPTICFDEWNVWDPVRAPGELGGEELYTLSDALAVATWLNVFVRQSKWMGMANIAQTVNVISPLMTHPKGVTKQATYWPLYLASKYLRGRTLGAHVSCEQYKGKTNPVWLASTMEIPSLDVAAALDKEGWVNLSVVNIKDDGDIKAEIKGVEKANGGVQVFTVTGQDINVVNKLGDDKNVVVKESKWDGKGEYAFPKHSYTLLRWKE